MTTTPEPAVSPAPDTDALRQQVVSVLEGRIGDNSDLYETVDDVLALPWIKYAAGQRTVVTMHERNNAAIAETNRQLAEESTGLRADLDRARADRDKFADLHRGEAHTHDETITSLNAARAEVERLGQAVRAEASAKAESFITTDTWKHRHDNVLRDLENTRAELGSRLARSAGARTIPNDAAEQIATWLAGRFPIGLDGSKARTAARGVLKIVQSWATPTTGPEPEDLRSAARRHLAEALLSAAPQAPAQPTDDEYGENLTAGFLRPSAPPVDGDTPTAPTSEEA